MEKLCKGRRDPLITVRLQKVLPKDHSNRIGFVKKFGKIKY